MELGSRKFRQLGFVVAVSGAIDGVLNLGAGIQTLLRLGSIHGNEGTTHQVFGVFPRWNSRRQHHNKEPWLIGLISFHVFLLLVSFLSRKNINFQMCLFLLALGGVYLAERLNRILAANWTSFSGQNYFDLSGVFLSVVWYGPLLVIAILILLLLAYVVAVRYEGLEFDMQMVEFDANSLYTAREKKIDTDEKTFIRIFSERSRAHLAVVCSTYHNMYGKSLKTLLHKAMKGMGTNDSTLIRVIVTRTEIDMQYINAAYHKKYGK